MKKQITIITAALSLVLFSCKKSDTNPNPQGGGATSSKIKTWAGNSGISTYTYDAQGRCTEVLYSNGGKIAYEYQAGVVTVKAYNTANVLTSTSVYELNSEGLRIKETRPGNPLFAESTVYNSDKQPVKHITSNNGNTQVMDYFYSGGNYDSIRFTNNGNWSSTIIKTYYSDKLNTLSNDEEGVSFYGKENKNLVKTEQYTYPDGTKNDISNYTYEFDAKGRVVKETRVQGGNINISYITHY